MSNTAILENINNHDDHYPYANIIHIQGLPHDLNMIKKHIFNQPNNIIFNEELAKHLPLSYLSVNMIDDEYTGDIVMTLIRWNEERHGDHNPELMAVYWDTIVNVTRGIYERLLAARLQLTEDMHKFFCDIIEYKPVNHEKGENYPLPHSYLWVAKVSKYNKDIVGYDLTEAEQKYKLSHLALWGYEVFEDTEGDFSYPIYQDDDNLVLINLTIVDTPIDALRTLSESYDVTIRVLSGNHFRRVGYDIRDGVITVDKKEPSFEDVYGYLDELHAVGEYLEFFDFHADLANDEFDEDEEV